MAIITKARVIDLGELRHEDEFPAYVAIHGDVCDSPFALSPRVMCWSEDILLCRLDDCRNFWLNQKKKQRCKLQSVFDPVLGHQFGASYLAVFGDHPWQCLRYLEYQIRHQGGGCYFLNSPLNQNIYRKLGWDNWFDTQDRLIYHLTKIKAGGFNAEAFHARQSRFRRFIDRIGVASPGEMKAADANSIARRFGVWMGRVWGWSHGRYDDLALFPWIALAQADPPEARRDLEYPVNQWAYIEVLLREDFTRLCEQFPGLEGEHINRMEWQITLFNYQKITVKLSFRHPYSLHRDMPGFDTAIYQARYVYEDLVRGMQKRDRDLDLPDNMPFIAWEVRVCERIELAPMLWDLFANESDCIDYQKIMRLQNKLPTAFECYRGDSDFYPSQSFQPTPIGVEDAPEFDDFQWSSSSSERPLFYYPEAHQIEAPSDMRKFFLERSSSRWWLGQDALQSIRDYYILNDPQGRASWVYRDANGDWFKQGEYC